MIEALKKRKAAGLSEPTEPQMEMPAPGEPGGPTEDPDPAQSQEQSQSMSIMQQPAKKGGSDWMPMLARAIAGLAPIAAGAIMGGKEGAAIGSGVGADYLNTESKRDYKQQLADSDPWLQKMLLSDQLQSNRQSNILKQNVTLEDLRQENRNETEAQRAARLAAEKQKDRDAAMERTKTRATMVGAGKPDPKIKASEIDARDMRKEVLGVTDKVYNASSRKQIGVAKQFENQINRVEGLLSSAGMHRTGRKIELRDLAAMDEPTAVASLDALTPQDVAEVVRGFNGMFTQGTGVGSVEERQQLFPETMRLLASKEWQKISNDPTPAKSGAFVHRMFKTFLAEKNINQKRLKGEVMGLSLPTVQRVYGNPEYAKQYGTAIKRMLEDSYVSPEDLPEEVRGLVYPQAAPQKSADQMTPEELMEYAKTHGIK